MVRVFGRIDGYGFRTGSERVMSKQPGQQVRARYGLTQWHVATVVRKLRFHGYLVRRNDDGTEFISTRVRKLRA
jgi:hypothetical protein